MTDKPKCPTCGELRAEVERLRREYADVWASRDKVLLEAVLSRGALEFIALECRTAHVLGSSYGAIDEIEIIARLALKSIELAAQAGAAVVSSGQVIAARKLLLP